MAVIGWGGGWEEEGSVNGIMEGKQRTWQREEDKCNTPVYISFLEKYSIYV